MYCRIVFVLLSLFVAVAISQQNTQACIDAQSAVRANQPCFNAVFGLMDALNQNTSISAGVDLNVYCSAGCRNLVNRVSIACNDGDPDGTSVSSVSFTQLVCVTDADRMSCADLIFSPRFAMIRGEFDSEASGVCPFEMPTGQVCPSACQTAIQNFAINGGCCVPHIFAFVGDESSNEVIAQCDVDYSRGGTCTELIGGGATGLKAFGSLLLFAIIIAVTLI